MEVEKKKRILKKGKSNLKNRIFGKMLNGIQKKKNGVLKIKNQIWEI